MPDKAAVIDATLARWRDTPFSWDSRDEADCLMSLARYVRDATGRDIGAPFRGRYANEVQALALVAALGGLATTMGGVLADHGFARVTRPELGDLLAVEADGTGRAVGGLCTGEEAAFRRDRRGYLELPLRHLRLAGVWRVWS